MIERRPIKNPDVATAGATNGSGAAAEITLASPLQDRLAELERRISTGLIGERTAHDLANLLMQTDLAIPQAEEFAKLENEKSLDPLQTPASTIREARQAAEDATFASNRLRTLRPRLLARYHEVSAAEQRAQYLVRYTDLKHEGAALAQELADLYPGLVGPLVDVFVRLRAFQEKSRALHLTDPGGLPHVNDPELQARGFHGFTRDTPSLLDSVRLYDWQSGREVWPPPSNFAATFVQSMGVPMHPGAAWSEPEFQARLAAEQQQQRERMAAHYAQAAREQEEMENRTLRENWIKRQGGQYG